MSSEIDGGGIVMAAVAVPAAAAAATAVMAAAAVTVVGGAIYGTGWLAVQGGKLLVEANRTIDYNIELKKRQQEEEKRHRVMSARAAHKQLMDTCRQVLSQLEKEDNGKYSDEVKALKGELIQICNENTDDVVRLETLTSLGYLKLDRILREQQHISELKMMDAEMGEYNGLTVADMMAGLRIAVGSMDIKDTKSDDVKAADPDVLDRIELNHELVETTNRIMMALEAINRLSSTYGMTKSGNAWLSSCFNGIDELIAELCKPTTTNEQLKKGIKRLRNAMERYEQMAPGIEKEILYMLSLYNEVYVKACGIMGEQPKSITDFDTAEDVLNEIEYLKERAKRAEECAKIYRTLGPEGYMCYAWDMELRAMGYKVHTASQVSDMAEADPKNVTMSDGKKLPYYDWDGDVTQLYSISEECDLQLIVHEDGTVTMQTIADKSSEKAVAVQREHCSRMKLLHQRLREKWFIVYDYEETESAEKVTTTAQWRSSDRNAWNTENYVYGRRTPPEIKEGKKQLKNPPKKPQ